MLIGLLEEENELHGELEFWTGAQPPQTSDHYYAKLSNCPYVLTKIETVQLVRMEGE